MKMYASRTSAELPWRVGQKVNVLRPDALVGQTLTVVIRENIQRNRPNPALLHFRQMHGHKRGADLHHAAVAWVASLMHMSLVGCYTIDQAKHARAVLQRIANLTTAPLDPEPYVDQWGIDRNEDGDPAGYDFDVRFSFKPRPQYSQNPEDYR